jgi:hypothetical protein
MSGKTYTITASVDENGKINIDSVTINGFPSTGPSMGSVSSSSPVVSPSSAPVQESSQGSSLPGFSANSSDIGSTSGKNLDFGSFGANDKELLKDLPQLYKEWAPKILSITRDEKTMQILEENEHTKSFAGDIKNLAENKLLDNLMTDPNISKILEEISKEPAQVNNPVFIAKNGLTALKYIGLVRPVMTLVEKKEFQDFINNPKSFGVAADILSKNQDSLSGSDPLDDKTKIIEKKIEYSSQDNKVDTNKVEATKEEEAAEDAANNLTQEVLKNAMSDVVQKKTENRDAPVDNKDGGKRSTKKHGGYNANKSKMSKKTYKKSTTSNHFTLKKMSKKMKKPH